MSLQTEIKANLVLHGHRVPRHVDAFDGAEGRKGLPDGVLAQLIVDGAHVDAAHDGQGPLSLRRHLPTGGGGGMRGRQDGICYLTRAH